MAQKSWLDIDEVRRQMELAADYAANQARLEYTEGITGRIDCDWYPFESPLEAIFWMWWEAATQSCAPLSYGGRLALVQQRHVVTTENQRFRLDFVVVPANPTDIARFNSCGAPFPRIAIEVDGHGFHEKTREQVAIRNQRDRMLQRENWVVFHFSWSELVQDGAACIGQVTSHAAQCLMNCDAAYYRLASLPDPDKDAK